MALIQWGGSVYRAQPIRELESGDWLMKAIEHGPRFTIGTEIRVSAKHVVEMDAAEMPDTGDAGASLGRLEADLAKERKVITPVTEVLAKAREKAPTL